MGERTWPANRDGGANQAADPERGILAADHVGRRADDPVKGTLRSAPRLRDVWVEGEVGQVSISAAGHCYFTLKDERAQLRCVVFRDERLMMPFEARTGLRLVAHGHLDVFEPQGAYQLYVEIAPAVGLWRPGAADSRRSRPSSQQRDCSSRPASGRCRSSR